MEHIKNLSAVPYAQGGVPCPDSKLGCQLTEHAGVFACRVNAACDKGFDRDAAICLRPALSSVNAEFTAIHNHSPYWCRPVFGTDLRTLPEKLVESLLIRRGESWEYYLPVCDSTYKTAIRGCDNGFEFYMYTGCDGITACEDQLAFVYAQGSDPFQVVESCAQTAAKLLGNGLKMRHERSMPQVLEYLGWCSWDAMQIRINHDDLLVKVKEFADKNVPVHFAVLDDMWADVPGFADIPEDAEFLPMIRAMKKCAIRSFDGAPNRFPQGMPATVQAIKDGGIPHVGVWFPTTGYWFGFDPEGEAKNFMDQLAYTPEGRLIIDPEPEKAQKHYSMLCRRILDWGADFVKIDNQGMHHQFYTVKPIGYTARAIQRALDHAAEACFDGAMINCMGMPSECMFNRPDSAVSRCSDDFIPESREWFAKNVLQSAYNGLLQGQYYINDWDMWWTDDAQASKNSLCRAISGGPIYISDKIGRTQADVLKPLIFADGRILRCDNSAMPTADCLIGDPTQGSRAFKVHNRIGDAGVVAAFNMDAQNRSVIGTISAADARLARDVVCYEYFTGACQVLKAGEKLPFTLENNDQFRLYTLVPLQPLTILGRTDKFMSVRAVTERSGNTVTLYEGGPVGFVCHRPVRVFAGERELTVRQDGILYWVECKAEETSLTFVTE